jgi:nucleolar protein 56
MAPTHVLLETASGYGVFESKLYEEIGSRTADVQKSIDNFQKFQKMVSLVSFLPFRNAAHALENANDVSEGKRQHSGRKMRLKWNRRPLSS